MRSKRPILAAFLALLAAPAAAQTSYPLTLANCGHELSFPAAPRRVVSIGQATTEILYALGAADRVVGTAVWFGPVPARWREADARIKRLADNDPSFESVVAQDPQLVAAQYEWHVGPQGSVAKREQFAALRIPAYVAPADCAAGKNNAGGGDGTRASALTMEPTYAEIRDFGAILDLPGNADALVAALRRREADAVASVASLPRGIPMLFWFSSRDVKGDAFVAGRNGAPAFIMSAIGARNVITVNDEWPTVGWESIAATEPAVIVLARMDRRRFPADDVDVKLNFLRTDPVASRMEAVRRNRIVVMDAQAMNPGMRTIDGIETLATALRGFDLSP